MISYQLNILKKINISCSLVTYYLQLILDSCLLEQIIKKMYSIAQEVTRHSELLFDWTASPMLSCSYTLGYVWICKKPFLFRVKPTNENSKNRFLFLQIIIDNYDTFLKPKFLFCNKDVTRIPGVWCNQRPQGWNRIPNLSYRHS